MSAPIPDRDLALLRILMRGNREATRVGHNGPEAVLAVCRERRITDVTRSLELVAYAYGYALALNGDGLGAEHLCQDHGNLCADGYRAGLCEDQRYTMPAPVNDRGCWDTKAVPS